MNTKEKKEETKTDLLKQLPADFFKQFKNMREIEDFFSELFKAGVQNLLQAEMDEHLGYEKHAAEGIHSGNSRNGNTSKLVKTKNGMLELEVPRDRKSTFAPRVVRKR